MDTKYINFAQLVVSIMSVCLVTVTCYAEDHKVVGSGFLGDYSKLKSHPDTKREGAMVYIKPDLNLGSYHSIYVAFPHIQIKSEAGDAIVDPRELAELAEYFHDKMVGALEGNYALEDEPGAGVLVVRTVIVDVEPINSTTGVLGKLALKVVNLEVGKASIEAEFLDGESGEQLAALIETRGGDRVELGMAGAKKWGHAKAAFKQWSKLLDERLDDFGMPKTTE